MATGFLQQTQPGLGLDSRQQIVYLCEELAGRDETTLTVALDGIANILDTAENLDEIDKVATMVEECGGLNRIHQLQYFQSEQIHRKCLSIMETFFPDDDQMEEEIAPIMLPAWSPLSRLVSLPGSTASYHGSPRSSS